MKLPLGFFGGCGARPPPVILTSGLVSLGELDDKVFTLGPAALGVVKLNPVAVTGVWVMLARGVVPVSGARESISSAVIAGSSLLNP